MVAGHGQQRRIGLALYILIRRIGLDPCMDLGLVVDRKTGRRFMDEHAGRKIKSDALFKVIGTDEKQSILGWLRALPLEKYTVLVCDFANWADTAPLPCFVIKREK